jgi:hypothetical protein
VFVPACVSRCQRMYSSTLNSIQCQEASNDFAEGQTEREELYGHQIGPSQN